MPSALSPLLCRRLCGWWILELFMVLGRQWLLLPGLALEAIPGLGVLPFWLLVVGAIAVLGTPRPTFERH